LLISIHSSLTFLLLLFVLFFLESSPITEIYPLSLHDALPISATTPEPAPTTRTSVSWISGTRCDAVGELASIVQSWHAPPRPTRSEEHTSELQSREKLVCRLLLEKKKSRYKYIKKR